MRKILLILLASFALLSPLCAQEEDHLSSLLDRDSILIGDQVKWSIKLRLAEGEEAFIEEPGEPVAQGVETIEGFRIDTLSDRKGKMEVEGRMILTSFDSGSWFLPPLIVMIQRADGAVDTLYYDGPTLEVNTIPIDTATFQPFDIKDQIKYPVTFKETAPWLGLAILLAAAIYALVRYVRYRRQNRDFFGKPIVKDPAHIVALRDLEKIRGQKLWQNNKQKQFYTAVTDTLRQYIAERYEIPAMEQTSGEMFEDLKDKEIDARLMDQVKDLFTTADYVKFAKHNASDAENEEAIPTAVKFVNSTFLQQMEKEKEEGK
jgi:hypothetical protein